MIQLLLKCFISTILIWTACFSGILTGTYFRTHNIYYYHIDFSGQRYLGNFRVSDSLGNKLDKFNNYYLRLKGIKTWQRSVPGEIIICDFSSLQTANRPDLEIKITQTVIKPNKPFAFIVVLKNNGPDTIILPHEGELSVGLLALLPNKKDREVYMKNVEGSYSYSSKIDFIKTSKTFREFLDGGKGNSSNFELSKIFGISIPPNQNISFNYPFGDGLPFGEYEINIFLSYFYPNNQQKDRDSNLWFHFFVK